MTGLEQSAILMIGHVNSCDYSESFILVFKIMKCLILYSKLAIISVTTEEKKFHVQLHLTLYELYYYISKEF